MAGDRREPRHQAANLSHRDEPDQELRCWSRYECESYEANNGYLIAAVLGHELDVFWFPAESQSQSFHSTVDFDREGPHLYGCWRDLGDWPSQV